MIITGKYPNLRLRRNRKSDWSRRLVQENKLSVNDLILPIFITEGKNIKQPIKTMPGVHRYSVNKLPLIIDAGLGQASDATIAMELGCDGVLVNTAIAKAKRPFLMAYAMKYAVESGRKSYLSGRIAPNLQGSPSTTKKGLI